MIRKIMVESNIIAEGKELKKGDFEYVYVDEIKDMDEFVDTDELGDRKNVEVRLITDKNHKPDDPESGEFYKISTEKLLKHLSKTMDKIEKGDNIDLTGGYNIMDLVCSYLESECECTLFKSYEDFTNTVEIPDDLNK